MTIKTWQEEFYPISADRDDSVVNKIKRDIKKGYLNAKR